MRLVINIGSASKKYAWYRENERLLTVRFDVRGDGFGMAVAREGKAPADTAVDADAYDASLARTLEIAQTEGVIGDSADIQAIGVRIVAPGEYFTEHRRIDDDFLKRFAEMQPYAPLHITPTLAEVQHVRDTLSQVPLYGISDSAFHATIPDIARRYSTAHADTETYDIRRFGYHGLSVSSVIRTLQDMECAEQTSRTIVCHIGGGVSMTAVRDGESVDTSMGFSPVGGLHMGTRTGDIDPGALIYLAQKKDMSYEALRNYLNTEGGLKGIAGVSDMRIILERYEQGDENAKRAIDMFVYRIQKYIGSYIAALGGFDTLVLTATVSERNAFARELLCAGLAHMDIVLDREKNAALAEDSAGCIGSGAVQIAVVPTDEMGEIARVMGTMN